MHEGTSQGRLPPFDDGDFPDYDDIDSYLPYLPDYNAIDDEEFDFGEGHVSIVHESIINAQMAAMAEYQMIRDYQIRRNCKPRSYQKKGELIILKDPVVTFCVVCNAYVTLHCKNDKDDSGSHCPYECSVCLKFGRMDTHCPYQYHARKGAEVGHGGVLVCIYNKEGVHPGKDDWVGRAAVKRGRVSSVNNT
ncbi:hypothetical protein DVH24_039438 [Malus domestica]|uniref:Uncharacterized protein n=1 Tax=Malus domestica TaxID=3750 RepID=A0A498HYN5_MALDO|nr:hypothetical protein DVH24_039438 [Malus domestica]